MIEDIKTKKSGLIITIDGPAGSGKSTTAKQVAQELEYLYLDTGAMYRAVTLKVLLNGISENQKQKVNDLLAETEVSLKKDGVSALILLDGKDVSGLIRTSEIDAEISWVCQIPSVRDKMVALQREIGKIGSIVAEGRDMGSVVFPDAEYKFFLIASLEERGKRRWLQLQNQGDQILIEEVQADIERRDKIDSERVLSPLVKPEKAIEIDTSNLTIQQQTNLIIQEVRKYLSKI